MCVYKYRDSISNFKLHFKANFLRKKSSMKRKMLLLFKDLMLWIHPFSLLVCTTDLNLLFSYSRDFWQKKYSLKFLLPSLYCHIHSFISSRMVIFLWFPQVTCTGRPSTWVFSFSFPQCKQYHCFISIFLINTTKFY